METMIDIIDVSKSYGKGLPAVNHANLHVDKGEFVFVVGSSGSGTTVLVVTHNKEIVNAMKKRVVTMHDGVIVSDEKEGEYHEA